MLNISTRARAETGDNALIGGFILGNGSASKQIVVRAIGPSLGARGVLTPLLDPSLQLFDSSGGLITSNNDWATDLNAQAVIDAGLAPSDSREAAVSVDLAPDAYTVVVPGSDDPNNNIALVEVYDVDSTVTPELLNISTRGFVDTDDGVMIAGVIVGGTIGKVIVARGLGPSLGTFVSNPLPNPTLTIVNASGFAVASNDDWQSDPAMNDIINLGLAPTQALEAATEVTVAPGAYTAVLSDTNGDTGIGLVEIYNVTP